MFARLWSLLRLLFVWKIDSYPAHQNQPEADCVIALAFGQEENLVGLGAGLYTTTIVPGPVNEALAHTLTLWASGELLESTPILAQWELLETTDGDQYSQERPSFSLGKRGQYRNTHEVLMEAKSIMDTAGYRSAIILAQPWHLPRCIWVAEKIGIQVVCDDDLLLCLEHMYPIWNKDIAVPTDQHQTTSLPRWLWYEFRARGYFWLKGWI